MMAPMRNPARISVVVLVVACLAAIALHVHTGARFSCTVCTGASHDDLGPAEETSCLASTDRRELSDALSRPAPALRDACTAISFRGPPA